MNNVNKTLYIPLYGKAYVSRKRIILNDPKAEAIWEAEGFPLKGKSSSKWLAYYIGMRAAVFDCWLRQKMEEIPDAVVLHIGCGMDSRVQRIGTQGHLWFDLDFPAVMAERKRYYTENVDYHMLAADVREVHWLESIPRGKPAIVVMEGVSMYLLPEEREVLAERLSRYSPSVCLLMDAYTKFAAKATKYKNPINEVGVTQVHGMDRPELPGLHFQGERELTPTELIDQLHGSEKVIFRKIFAGSVSKKLYRLYEYTS